MKNDISCIHLIRHGITEGNIKRWYYGASDIPLSSEGKSRLSELKKENIYPCYENADYYTTGLIRTEQTMQIIYGEREHSVLQALREMDFGDFEMKTHADLELSSAYQEWINDASGMTAPRGGESISAFQNRVAAGFEDFLSLHAARAAQTAEPVHSVVICHGGPIGVIMLQSFPGIREHIYKWIPDPGRGYTIEIKKNMPVGYSKI